MEDKKQTRGLRRAFGAAGIRLNSFLASGDFYHLLLTFANSLDPDQD